MSREEIAELIWRQVEPTVFISRREFMADLDGWEITPREIDSEIAGATMTRGAEFHFVSFGKRKPVPPALMIICLQPIIDTHGFVRTRTPKDDMRQRRFNTRVGFKYESEDDHFVFYRLEKLSLHGASPCQS